MKSSLVLAISLFAASSSMAAQVKLPDTLKCVATYDILGQRKASATDGSFKVSKINSPTGPESAGSQAHISYPLGKVLLDLGDGGDQYAYLTFANDSLEALAEGRVSSIGGIYEDGFDWANGYNVRGLFALKCTK